MEECFVSEVVLVLGVGFVLVFVLVVLFVLDVV